MKEKKKEEIKEVTIVKEKPIEVKTKNRFFTKERVITFIIGIFVGALLTSCVICTCMRNHHPRVINGPKTQMQERNRPNLQRRYDRPSKNKKQNQTTDSTEDKEPTNNPTQNNN